MVDRSLLFYCYLLVSSYKITHNIEKFLSDFTLAPPSNHYQNKSIPSINIDEKPLTISTIHSAKGLEWHIVFIPFALDGIIPSSFAIGKMQELAEESRLFYVVASRAKENLFITMPSYVSSWDAIFTKPSRYLKEIDKSNYNIEIQYYIPYIETIESNFTKKQYLCNEFFHSS
jgi:DNA helicase-2/ATP-dependent DNA helicase PcrA